MYYTLPCPRSWFKEDTGIGGDAYRVLGAHKAVRCSLSAVMK